MKGLMLIAGKPKAGGKPPAFGKPDDEDAEGDESSPAESYAREAFSALKDSDEEGFVQSFLGAVRACKSGSYSEEE